MPPLAVLFDFDGVIADTENVHIAAWQLTLARIGVHITDEVAARASEIDDRAWVTEVFAAKKIEKIDTEGWCRRKQELTIRMLNESPVVYPGVVPLVKALRGKAKLAVVSTTWRGNVEAVLKFAGLADCFELIVGKEDVAEVKPNPEAYLLAIHKLGIRPEDGVAIEDSPTGLAAASGAGIPVWAVGHRRPTGDWHAEAKGFLPSLADVDAAVAALLP